jgi:NADH dehydrogenase FAD-containing subunit
MLQYDLLHVTPPMGPAEMCQKATPLTNTAGYVEVDKSTMQHKRFPNIFAFGDCADSPNSKTAASTGS